MRPWVPSPALQKQCGGAYLQPWHLGGRQEEPKFEVVLGYMPSTMPVWAHEALLQIPATPTHPDTIQNSLFSKDLQLVDELWRQCGTLLAMEYGRC